MSPERREDGFLEKGFEGLSHNVITGTLEELVKWARARSVMPATFAGRRHYHHEQEETYFIHRGHAELEFGDGSVHRLGPGGVARRDVRPLHRVGGAQPRLGRRSAHEHLVR